VRPIAKYRDTLRSSVQKRLNRSTCCLSYGLGWAQGIIIGWVPDPPWEGQFLGKGAQLVKYRDFNCTKTAEPIDLPFGL